MAPRLRHLAGLAVVIVATACAPARPWHHAEPTEPRAGDPPIAACSATPVDTTLRDTGYAIDGTPYAVHLPADFGVKATQFGEEFDGYGLRWTRRSVGVDETFQVWLRPVWAAGPPPELTTCGIEEGRRPSNTVEVGCMPAYFEITSCRERIAEQLVWVSTARVSDGEPSYVVGATWEVHPGLWFTVSGAAADTLGQRQLLQAVRRVRLQRPPA